MPRAALQLPWRPPPNNDFLPTRADIDAVADGATSLIVNTPNNPTGMIYSPETLGVVAEAANRHDLAILSDEVYETQVWEGKHVSIRELPGMANKTLVIGSMSKGHGMTGSRIGWLVGPENIIAALSEMATVTTFGIPGFIQESAIFALSQGRELEKKVAEPFRSRRAAALDVLSKQNKVGLVSPRGAMYLFLDIRSTGMTGKDFAENLLREERIAVMPGGHFGRAASGYVRVAMTAETGRFVDALSRLVAFASRRQARTQSPALC